MRKTLRGVINEPIYFPSTIPNIKGCEKKLYQNYNQIFFVFFIRGRAEFDPKKRGGRKKKYLFLVYAIHVNDYYIKNCFLSYCQYIN